MSPVVLTGRGSQIRRIRVGAVAAWAMGACMTKSPAWCPHRWRRGLPEVGRSIGVACYSQVRSTPAPYFQAESSSAKAVAHVITCCTEYRQETAMLQRSATRNGFAFHAVGVGEPWGGFATKLLSYDAALKELIGDKIHPEDKVIVMDAWDTVILGTADELLEKTADLPHDSVLCGSERVCGPNHFLVAQIEALYPDGRTPWRYPNSGGLVASAEAMSSLFHGLVYDTFNGLALDADENDQVRLHDFLIGRASSGKPFPFQLDTNCKIFQCMYKSNRNGTQCEWMTCHACRIV